MLSQVPLQHSFVEAGSISTTHQLVREALLCTCHENERNQWVKSVRMLLFECSETAKDVEPKQTDYF